MSNQDKMCPKCPAIMKQIASEGHTLFYRCPSCGYEETETLASGDENSLYRLKRIELLGRVRKSILDWETAQWGYLKDDIMDFRNAHEAARLDIYFNISLIACLTSGFHDMDNEKYRECRRIFKRTEKIYKRYCKEPNADYNAETGSDGMETYKEYRALYKKCRSAYRNEKLLWKVAFFIAKRFVPIPKL